MHGNLEVLVVTKGHDFNHDAFLAMFDAIEGIDATLVQQPAAQVILKPQHIQRYAAVLFYDMSGIPGVGLYHDDANDTGRPPTEYVSSIEALLDQGTGIVLLNHATVSWPDWPSLCSLSSPSRQLAPQ